MADSYDLIVIGAGPGGYVAAIRAAQLGETIQPWSRAACKAPRPRRYSAAIDRPCRVTASRTGSATWRTGRRACGVAPAT